MRALVATLVALACFTGTAAAQLPIGGATGPTPDPYGTNDAGGFRNVLPPGENGRDTALEFAQFQANGTYPPHFNDQLGLYTGLLYASPHLKHSTSSRATTRT